MINNRKWSKDQTQRNIGHYRIKTGNHVVVVRCTKSSRTSFHIKHRKGVKIWDLNNFDRIMVVGERQAGFRKC